MKNFVFAAALVLLVSPAAARDIQVTFTEEEAQGIISSLDIAVKAGGLAVAGQALVIATKIQAAAKASVPPSPTSDSHPLKP